MKTGLIIAGIIGTAAVVGAQNRGGGFGPPAGPLVAALDGDRDGVISAAEIQSSPAALKTLDANGDGQLTVDEIRPAFGRGGPGARGNRVGGPDGRGPGGPEGAPGMAPGSNTAAPDGQGRGGRGGRPGGRGPRMGDPLMRALDADADGVISPAEIEQAPAALKTLDANHDGQLTPDEFRPPFGRGPGAGRDGGRDGR